MAYQLNKDTKILLVLLAVVVLCSAKLFKDYLYRNRYDEGMVVGTLESSVQLRRPNTTTAITADITINTVSNTYSRLVGYKRERCPIVYYRRKYHSNGVRWIYLCRVECQTRHIYTEHQCP